MRLPTYFPILFSPFILAKITFCLYERKKLKNEKKEYRKGERHDGKREHG
jgi:hypothetical protein